MIPIIVVIGFLFQCCVTAVISFASINQWMSLWLAATIHVVALVFAIVGPNIPKKIYGQKFFEGFRIGWIASTIIAASAFFVQSGAIWQKLYSLVW